ncbi:MAG: hypothetical protein UHD09_09230 [Bifidobacterium sp.]|nr:hypothetical protein [Bifidobacterium sp.]
MSERHAATPQWTLRETVVDDRGAYSLEHGTERYAIGVATSTWSSLWATSGCIREAHAVARALLAMLNDPWMDSDTARLVMDQLHGATVSIGNEAMPDRRAGVPRDSPLWWLVPWRMAMDLYGANEMLLLIAGNRHEGIRLVRDRPRHLWEASKGPSVIYSLLGQGGKGTGEGPVVLVARPGLPTRHDACLDDLLGVWDGHGQRLVACPDGSYGLFGAHCRTEQFANTPWSDGRLELVLERVLHGGTERRGRGFNTMPWDKDPTRFGAQRADVAITPVPRALLLQGWRFSVEHDGDGATVLQAVEPDPRVPRTVDEVLRGSVFDPVSWSVLRVADRVYGDWSASSVGRVLDDPGLMAEATGLAHEDGCAQVRALLGRVADAFSITRFAPGEDPTTPHAGTRTGPLVRILTQDTGRDNAPNGSGADHPREEP